MHLSPTLCRMFLNGELSAEAFVSAALSHLMDECPECRQRWQELTAARTDQATQDLVPCRLHSAQPGGQAAATAGSDEIAQQEARLVELRKQRRKARRDIKCLLELEPEARRQRIENARTRFRSKVFVELLLEEARGHVRQDARTSADLAALVPVAIHWMAGEVDSSWAFRMSCLATAVEANGLRIAGDFIDADRLFQGLKGRLRSRPTLGSADLAEVMNLEAALRFEQHRYEETERLLSQAILHHRLAGNVRGLAQSMLLRGQVHSANGDFYQARGCYSEVTAILDGEEEPYLAQSAVTGEVNALCGLGSYEAAEELLNRHRNLYEGHDTYRFAMLRNLEGLIAMGREDWTEAETAFLDCRDGCLEIGRDQDATLACLEIARTMLQQGKVDQVTEMASEVLEIFRARGAEQEALSALILIHEAAASRTLTTAILRQARKRLESGSG